ncbi:hypothetical protein HDU81_001778 [Chytriomyces hyalinus]|nr:hypothetical protein HDU81_001778 [Chytriomyces hyalinus]
MSGNRIKELHPYESEKECQVFIAPIVRVDDKEREKTDDNLAERLNLKALMLQCPRKECSQAPRVWRCEACCEIVRFDHKNDLYCSCWHGSKFPLSSAKFRCSPSSSNKGHEWVACSDGVSLAGVNVLIVGASGIGKSTVVNSLPNYIFFDDFNDAMANSSELKIPIPGQFTANGFGVRDDTGKLVNEKTSVISFGDRSKSTNENINNQGQSVTQYCKTYTINVYNRNINFIDPPGMLDSRGIEQDQKNSDHIISYICGLSHLSAILFVMKPNEERLTASIMYTFLQTFSRLNKDLANNVYFLFTTSSTTNYELGSTSVTIEELEKQLSTPERRLRLLQPEKMFFMDNAGFRLVCAKAAKRELSNDPDSQLLAANRTHWERSSKASKELIRSLLSAPQVETIGIMKLNETKLLISNISNVLLQVSKNIDANITSTVAKKAEIKTMQKNKVALDGKLNIRVRKAKVVPLLHPMTVCTGEACSEIIEVEGGAMATATEFKYIPCHSNCELEGVKLNEINHPHMKYCAAFQYGKLNCHFCEKRGHTCGPEKHMHMLTDVATYYEQCEVPAVKEELQGLASNLDEYEKRIQALEALRNEYMQEKEKIIEAMAKFAMFIRQESLIVPNDAVLAFFKQTIKGLEGLSNPTKSQEQSLTNTRALLASYEQQINLLNNATANAKNVEKKPYSIEAVDTELQLLYSLKYSGKEIKALIDELKTVQSSHVDPEKSSRARDYIPIPPRANRGKQSKPYWGATFSKFASYVSYGSLSDSRSNIW